MGCGRVPGEPLVLPNCNDGDDMKKAKPAKDIDEYIARFPADVQAILEKVRTTISKAAPEAKEVISYQMPAFKQHGILVYFAAWKKHIGLYPPISGDKALEKAVARYAGPKGNLQFPLDEPIPYELIERIVKLRVKQDWQRRRQSGRRNRSGQVWRGYRRLPAGRCVRLGAEHRHSRGYRPCRSVSPWASGAGRPKK